MEGREIVKGAVERGRKVLLEWEAKALLSSYGIRVPRGLIYRKGVKPSFKPPYVLKVISPQIIHKSDVGGVVRGLKSLEEVERTARDMEREVGRRVQGAVIEGFLLEEEVRSGLELIVGGIRDPQFGPLLSFGMGGIAVEIYKDVSYRLAPITGEEALDMVMEVKGHPLLLGYRGLEPVDVGAVTDTILKVSEIMMDVEEIEEFEINPLFAWKEGVMAVDARGILK